MITVAVTQQFTYNASQRLYKEIHSVRLLSHLLCPFNDHSIVLLTAILIYGSILVPLKQFFKLTTEPQQSGFCSSLGSQSTIITSQHNDYLDNVSVLAALFICGFINVTSSSVYQVCFLIQAKTCTCSFCEIHSFSYVFCTHQNF